MSRHLKSYAAPKSWTILRKVNKWILRPQPGAHELERSLPIGLLLKQLGCAQIKKESKKIINDKAVMIDGKIIKDIHFGIGFMDTVSIKPNTNLRCTLDQKGRLKFINIPESETNKKICRINNKTTNRKGKSQLNLSDGRNLLVEKKEYATGDSILIELPSQKIIEHFPLAKGNTAFITSGRHIGTIGTIQEIKENKVWCSKDKEKVETLSKFAFVVGKNTPAIKL
ncbi:30S ribosomal protein S4e [uncultured archaeon]|nr:30S ribosomal protein S4e [uncultured archaeon]